MYLAIFGSRGADNGPYSFNTFWFLLLSFLSAVSLHLITSLSFFLFFLLIIDKVDYYYDLFFSFFISRHTIVAGYYGFTLDVRVSVCPSVSRTSVRPFFVSG